ncbi:MAG: hypothetical protein ACRDSR_04410 [Pseudonocardiaceae bacterium]
MQDLSSVDTDGLRRYVLPAGEETRLDGDGFLFVPADGVWHFDPKSRPRPVGDLITSSASYVLLAPGGVGKTVTFKGLSGAERDARYIDLTVAELGELRQEIASAIADGVPVYLDALDQAELYEPRLSHVLEKELTAPTACGNAWRLACRPAAWKVSLTSALKGSLPAFEELKLLPMDRTTAQETVTSAGFDGEEFIEALIRANLGRLSATPQRLLATARHWHEKRILPDSHLVAIEFEVSQFLKETDDRRHPQLPADRAARVAKRIGAITTFAGVRRIAMASTDDAHATSVVDLPSSPEPDEPGTVVGPAEYCEVLGTALFDAGPSGALTFRHQQYAEYLAASYLADRGVAAAQLPALLGVHHNGLLPGVMVGVATWFAAMRPTLVTQLITDNAQAFTAAAVELPTQARAAVVDGLLREAACAELGPEWGLDLSGLVHPELDAQLASHLERGCESSEQLWWAARLAVAGKCQQLAPLLARHALDTRWKPWARRAAVKAVRELADETARRSLRSLLARDPTEDPDDELLSAAIDALYPQMLTTEELLSTLRAPQSPDLFGGYWVTLRHLAERVPVDDLPTFLNWFADQTRAAGGSELFEELFFGLVHRAWAEAHSGRIRTALADLLSSDAHLGRRILHESRREKPPWANGDVQLRRELAVAVAESVNADAWDTLFPLSLLAADDVVWLIDQLPSLSPRASCVLARCLPYLLHEPTEDIANRIRNLDLSHPAYDSTGRFRQPVDLNTLPVTQWSEKSAAELESQQQQSANQKQLRAKLAAALERSASDPSTWWQITVLISSDDQPRASSESKFSHDLKRRRGWPLLSATEQERVLTDGLNHLRTHRVNPADWRNPKTVTVNQVIPHWSGVYLMTTLTRHAPEIIRALEPAVWEEWAPAIVAAWNFDRDEDAGLRQELVHLAPPHARQQIVRAALDHLDILDTIGEHLSLYPLYEYLAEELAAEIAQRLPAGRYSSGIGHGLLDLLTQHSPAIARQACRALKDKPESALSTQAAQHLAALDPNGTVDDLATTQLSTAEFAEIIRYLRVDALDHEHLADAGRLLLDAFSYDDDPPPQSGFHSRDATDEAREIRAEVLRRLAALGHTQTLIDLREGRPPIDRKALSGYERTARTREADIAFEPLSPKGLLDLLGRSDSRLVRNDADLLDVVLEHLNELQRQITHNGASGDIWNDTTHPKTEDDISDWIRRRLQERFHRGLVIDREIQVQRIRQGGIGTRIDLTATAPTATQPPSTARVIIEAKLINNPDLMTAMDNQLVQRYLVPLGLQHGIYLIYWITPDQRPKGWVRTKRTDRNDIQEQLERQASTAPSDAHIKVYILDISRPIRG